MDYFPLHGGARGGKQDDAQSAGVHRWLVVTIRELSVLMTEATGHDAFIE